MPRQRKSATKPLTSADERLANLKSIDPALNLGEGLTNTIYESSITTAYNRLETYNSTLALADSQLNEFTQAEKVVQDLSERMLSGVGVKYGFDSDEYEMAGGKRKSERAKPTKKPKTP